LNLNLVICVVIDEQNEMFRLFRSVNAQTLHRFSFAAILDCDLIVCLAESIVDFE
jgi:hypothetical protein